MSIQSTKTPRGIRNNNPLNIRIGNTWLGEVPDPTDSNFEQFVNIKYGLRAAFCILRRYIRRYKRNTVRKIVTAWAPSSENNTERYIELVCKFGCLDADMEIHYEDSVTMCSLVQAMARVEVGEIIPLQTIEDAYKIA